MGHLMGKHGWKKPCPLMQQGGKNKVGQLASKESWEKIAANFVTNEQRSLEPEESSPQKNQKIAKAKPTTKKRRHSKANDKESSLENQKIAKAKPMTKERSHSEEQSSLGISPDNQTWAAAPSLLHKSGFFINPQLSRDEVEKAARQYLDEIVDPRVNKLPDLMPCPLLLKVLSPKVVGVDDYGEDYTLRMYQLLVQGDLQDEKFLEHLQKFLGTIESDNLEYKKIRSLAYTTLLPLFLKYRAFVGEEIASAFEEVKVFCHSYVSHCLLQENNRVVLSKAAKCKEALVKVKLTEHELLQPFQYGHDINSFMSACPDMILNHDSEVSSKNSHKTRSKRILIQSKRRKRIMKVVNIPTLKALLCHFEGNVQGSMQGSMLENSDSSGIMRKGTTKGTTLESSGLPGIMQGDVHATTLGNSELLGPMQGIVPGGMPEDSGLKGNMPGDMPENSDLEGNMPSTLLTHVADVQNCMLEQEGKGRANLKELLINFKESTSCDYSLNMGFNSSSNMQNRGAFYSYDHNEDLVPNPQFFKADVQGDNEEKDGPIEKDSKDELAIKMQKQDGSKKSIVDDGSIDNEEKDGLAVKMQKQDGPKEGIVDDGGIDNGSISNEEMCSILESADVKEDGSMLKSADVKEDAPDNEEQDGSMLKNADVQGSVMRDGTDGSKEKDGFKEGSEDDGSVYEQKDKDCLRHIFMTKVNLGFDFQMEFVDMLLDDRTAMTTACFDVLFQYELRKRGGMPQKAFCIDPLALLLKKGTDAAWKHVNVADFLVICIPVIREYHWTLIVVGPKGFLKSSRTKKQEKCIFYLNSMAPRRIGIAEKKNHIVQNLVKEILPKELSNLPLQFLKVPKQPEESLLCGWYTFYFLISVLFARSDDTPLKNISEEGFQHFRTELYKDLIKCV